ncbi:DUF3592 domain-containing protein [Kitasatospora purpeofusca]|uniref:DUF3592 domain-containing protein n=1 Tax=Kitasatospora purpeofusca TaxID=67352 RepID=UPI00367FA8B0
MTNARRVGGARKFLVLVLGLLTALGGWTLGTGWIRSVDHAACRPQASCGGALTASALVVGVHLCLLGLFCALALAENREPDKPQRLPLGAASAGAVSLALLGAALGNGSALPWLFAAAAAFGLLTVVAGVRGERRIRRENRDHLREHTLAARLHAGGVTATGTVTEVAYAGREQRGGGTGPHRLRLTVRYTGPDGRPYTLAHTGRYPVYALPTVGGEVTVRHDPLDPSAAVVPVTGAVGTRSPGNELALLADLHREGSLDTAEFAAAKALLLRTGLSAGASGGL